MKRLSPLAASALCAALCLSAAPPQDEEGSAELTLEKLYDEDGLFGRPPRTMAISANGEHGAFLWRPYAERRHGSDLYLVDLATDELTRVTSVSVLAPFQASTRKVADDRIEKARKGRKKEKDDDAEKGTWSELQERARGKAGKDAGSEVVDDDEDALMDTVGDDDADDEKAPRYGGVSSFTWAPDASELLLTSGGDVYRYVLGDDAGLVRLTKTRASERNVSYLPDGSGYTALVEDALVGVRFGDHFAHQLDPRLPGGMTMRSYELSPDGKRIVFIASNSERSTGDRRTVDIATYRDRFMKVRTVPRTVSDDPIARTTTAVFLYELPAQDREDGRLVKIFERRSSGPRDVLRLPDWAPDSSRVTFAVFDQSTSQVHVLEGRFPDTDDEEGEGDADDESGEKGKKKDPEAAAREAAKGGDAIVHDARVVHRFLHTGGPNTPRMMAPRYMADSRHIVLLTEQTGFRHLHVLDPLYETLVPLTSGHFEVYPLDMPRDRSCMFVEATREDSACIDVYRVDLESGDMERLTRERGMHQSSAVSDDGKHVLTSFVAYGSPAELVHVDTSKRKQTKLTDSHPERAHELTGVAPTFFEFENRHGQTIHGFVFEPERRSRDELRPMLLYVYGGPLGTRKQVTEGNFNSASYLFARYMTEVHGWVTVTIDPRGMSGYGAAFEKANFEQVGKPQVEDLVDGVRHAVAEYGVDAERVAMHGWSFGGFQTQMCLYTEPEVFRCGIAGAGPTEWENYNSWYSTGTIGESREGETDLAKYSLLPLAKNLERKLLLVHGMEDSNVLYQDTVRVYAELLDAGKEALVELFVDPTGGHGLGGHVKRLNQYRKYEEFLLRANVAPAEDEASGD